MITQHCLSKPKDGSAASTNALLGKRQPGGLIHCYISTRGNEMSSLQLYKIIAREEDFFTSWQGQESAQLVPPPLFSF